MEMFRAEAREQGYNLIKCGYVYKEKTQKKEVIDSCYVISVTKEFQKVWDNLEV